MACDACAGEAEHAKKNIPVEFRVIGVLQQRHDGSTVEVFAFGHRKPHHVLPKPHAQAQYMYTDSRGFARIHDAGNAKNERKRKEIRFRGAVRGGHAETNAVGNMSTSSTRPLDLTNIYANAKVQRHCKLHTPHSLAQAAALLSHTPIATWFHAIEEPRVHA